MPRANFIVQRKYSVDVSWLTSLRATSVQTAFYSDFNGGLFARNARCTGARGEWAESARNTGHVGRMGSKHEKHGERGRTN